MAITKSWKQAENFADKAALLRFGREPCNLLETQIEKYLIAENWTMPERQF